MEPEPLALTARQAPAHVHIAVAGMGFSGTAVALHLMRGLSAGSRLTLIDAGPEPGRGLAYGDAAPEHRLNVRAARMGLWAEDEGDFLHWLHQQGGPDDGDAFAPRLQFGRYLQHRLAEGVAARPDLRISMLRGRVTAVRPHSGGFALAWQGPTLQADQVVLALGHAAAAAPPSPALVALQRPLYVHEPFAPPGPLDGLAADDPVLLLGSGLTMVDLAASLARRRHRGAIWVMSRRARLPGAHTGGPARLPDEAHGTALHRLLAAQPNLRTRLACLREVLRRGEPPFDDDRHAIAALREHTPALWQQLSPAERGQFLRHLAIHWDTRRHLAAPPSAQAVDELRATGQLRLLAGRLRSAEADGGRLRLQWQPRGATTSQALRVARVINCTGPASGGTLAPWPVLAGLARAGLAQPCPLGQGLRVDAQHRLINAHGHGVPGLYYVGPLLKAQHWEAVAVPELRRHAAALAQALLHKVKTAA